MLRHLTLVAPDGEEFAFMSNTSGVVSVEGLPGLSAPRRVTRARPGGHGSINRSRFRDAKYVTITGELWGGSPEVSLIELDRVNGVLSKCVDEQGMLRFGRGSSGIELQVGVKLASDVKVPLQGAASMLPFSVQFEVPDPHAYSIAEDALVSGLMGADGGGFYTPLTFPFTLTRSNAGLLAYENRGNAPAPVVFRVYGYAVDPRIVLTATGDELVIEGTVKDGDFIELDANYTDPDRRVIRVNGNAERLDRLNFAESRWFRLPPGSGTVRLIAAEAAEGAYLTCNYRHTYG